jgi:ubiquinone/menaquinone biosynthesis C-methylase UbiE
MPDYIKRILPLIHDDIKAKFYGCGSPIPLCIDGLKVLYVGCGTGRDCYIMSKLVGEGGFVYGIDMTENQLAVAQRYREEQTRRFAFTKPNVQFILDDMESIEQHFARESLDLVTSNCVVNLAEDKEVILQQVYNVLQSGGEFYFSDVYADRRIPDTIKDNEVLYGECLGGALYYRDFERIARTVGFADPRVVVNHVIPVNNDDVKKLIGDITFYSITYRLWKLEGLEDACEDYGQSATYLGGIPETPLAFRLDGNHLFEKNKPERICANTALMLLQTRFKQFFKVTGDCKEHLGAFRDCSTTGNADDQDAQPPVSESCC